MSRIYEQCVSSEDIKLQTGATHLSGYMQAGYGIYINQGRNEIGRINYHAEYLGDDYIIDSIVVNSDKSKSNYLSKKYKGKILIVSYVGDNCS